jgi:protein TonB
MAVFGGFMREAQQTARPLLFFLGISALVHGGFLWLAPVKARPADNFRSQRQRVTLVNLPLPAPPQRVSPPPPRNPVLPAAPETITEAPQALQETVPEYAGPAEALSPGEAAGPPVPAAVIGPEVDPALREAAVSRYLAVIRGLIDRRKEYPYQARRQEQEGTVVIRFTVTREGTLAGEPALEKKSRHDRLNASAIEAVKKAAPYPPFPG